MLHGRVGPGERPANLDAPLRLYLNGRFRLIDKEGVDRTPRGQKTCAILAMLYVARRNTRSRVWLREHLWSDRGVSEGLASLRQSLAELRRTLGPYTSCLLSDRLMLALRPDCFAADEVDGSFLEDLSIRDEAYLGWRDEMRSHLEARPLWQTPAEKLRPFLDDSSTPQLRYPLKGARTDAVTDEGAQHANEPVSGRVSTMGRFPSLAVPMATGNHTARDLRRGLVTHRWLSVLSADTPMVRAEYTIHTHGDDSGTADGIELADAGGRVIWTGHRKTPEEGFETVTTFEERAIGNIAVLIANTEEQRAANAPDDDDVRNLLWRGRWHLNHMSRNDVSEADRLFARAHFLAPHDTDVAVHLAYAEVARTWASRIAPSALEGVIAAARKATIRDPGDARNFYNLGTALCFARQQEEASVAIDEAIRLCPTFAMAWIQRGCNLLAEGRYTEATATYHRCLVLGRFERRRYIPWCGLALAHLYLGEDEEAVAAAAQAIALREGYWYAHMVHGAACRRAGRENAAERSLAKMRKIFPAVTRADVEWLPMGDREGLQRLVEDVGLAR